ncbi:MAG TPA: response regulator transcription factor [Solirubrobacteraceae bacterium]|nr:response regulator transcription factor [Solirubrobacteraceae bacterium]
MGTSFGQDISATQETVRDPVRASGSPRTGIRNSAPPATDETSGAVRVVIAEDSYVIREFLTTALGAAQGIELAAVCTNGKELQMAIETWDPQVVLTDIRMPPSGAEEGVRIASRLRETRPSVGVVVLSQYAEPAYAISVLEQGTAGRAYLLKERIRNKDELIGAIRAVADGGSVIDPMIVDVLIEARSRTARSRLTQLTPRERELLAEIAAGKSNGAIAESLVLTKRAVEKHVNSIFAKLNLPETQDVSRRVKATLIYLSEEETDAS